MGLSECFATSCSTQKPTLIKLRIGKNLLGGGSVVSRARVVQTKHREYPHRCRHLYSWAITWRENGRREWNIMEFIKKAQIAAPELQSRR